MSADERLTFFGVGVVEELLSPVLRFLDDRGEIVELEQILKHIRQMQRHTDTDFQDTELLLPWLCLVWVEEQPASVEQQDWTSSLHKQQQNFREEVICILSCYLC